MIYRLIVQKEALLELKNAFEWYEKQKEGLGYELIEEVEICYEKICTHPKNYLNINAIYRRIKTIRFPYFIVYEIDGDNIIVNSIIHGKRKPRF